MRNRIVRYIFIMLGIAILWLSTSRRFMQFVIEKRDGTKWWCGYPMLHGDLISMSYLDFVKKLNPDPVPAVFKRPVDNGIKNTVLYLHGDSYTRHLGDTIFAGITRYVYFDRNIGGTYHLDTSRKNVLVIEISERYLAGYFSTPRLINELRDSTVNSSKVTTGFRLPSPRYYASLPGVSIDLFFNKYINQNLQCNLFNYNFIIPMFEWKAALNYYLFNRASGDVVISDDRNFLFLKETVSTDHIGSSYRPINAEEIKRMVDNFNAIYDHYKAAGFREVYLSMIPNAATIMQPKGYNNMIPLIQNDPHLRMKVIDIYSVFKNSPEVFYRHGDTHWNTLGLQKWLDVVNERLVQ